MNNISNLNIYVQRMEKSFLDKMFFIDKIFESVDNILDFGCANGILIRAMKLLFPEYRYIGYDINEDMLAKARELVPEVEFFSEWEKINIEFTDSLLNISSTLHEVYSYGTEDSVKEFWDRVYNSGFKYIAIRDMMVSDKTNTAADLSDIQKVKCLYPDKLRDFEDTWGKITTKKALIHYLLKYSYTENWDREVRENYLPITVEELMNTIPDNYEVMYYEHYVLPYIGQKIKKDSGIDITDSTHIKIMLKMRD